jgi:hypothetical protein
MIIISLLRLRLLVAVLKLPVVVLEPLAAVVELPAAVAEPLAAVAERANRFQNP